jgi:hypothetical protein
MVSFAGSISKTLGGDVPEGETLWDADPAWRSPSLHFSNHLKSTKPKT